MWIAIALGTVLVLLVLLFASQVGGDPTAADRSSRLLGKPAPAFTVTTLDGKQISLDTLRGKTVLVNFWNTWCIPCQQEAPALRAFAAQHRDDPSVELVGIVREDTEDAVRKHEADDPTGWIAALDPDSKAALAFGTRGQPETFAISPDGYITGFQYGAASERGLEQMLAAAQS